MDPVNVQIDKTVALTTHHYANIAYRIASATIKSADSSTLLEHLETNQWRKSHLLQSLWKTTRLNSTKIKLIYQIPSHNHLLQLNKNQTTQEVHSSEPTQNQLSFLVSMINKLREDMGKQIEELKHQQAQNDDDHSKLIYLIGPFSPG